VDKLSGQQEGMQSANGLGEATLVTLNMTALEIRPLHNSPSCCDCIPFPLSTLFQLIAAIADCRDHYLN
jgi:hypothetical protein